MKILGIIGLICIIIGLLLNKRRSRDFLYIAGGVLLGVYSIYIKDVIFTVLQAAFVLATVYDMIRLRFGKVKNC